MCRRRDVALLFVSRPFSNWLQRIPEKEKEQNTLRVRLLFDIRYSNNIRRIFYSNIHFRDFDIREYYSNIFEYLFLRPVKYFISPALYTIFKRVLALFRSWFFIATSILYITSLKTFSTSSILYISSVKTIISTHSINYETSTTEIRLIQLLFFAFLK